MKNLTLLVIGLFLSTFLLGQNLSVEGKIGIGIDPPVHDLDILSTDFEPVKISSSSAAGTSILFENGGTEANIGLGNSDDIIFRNGSFTDARITSNGNFVLENGRRLGINIDNPTQYFQIDNTGQNTTPFSMWITAGNGLFKLNGRSHIHLQNLSGSTTNFWHLGQRDDESFDIAYGAEANTFVDQTDAKLSIQPDGRVGIGTTSPGTGNILTVVGGDVRVEDSTPFLELNSIQSGNGNGAVLFQQLGSTQAGVFFDNGEDQIDISYSSSPSDGITVERFGSNQHIGLSTDAIAEATVIINDNGSISQPHLVIRENNNGDFARLQFKQNGLNTFWDVSGFGGGVSSDGEFIIRWDNSVTGNNFFTINQEEDNVLINADVIPLNGANGFDLGNNLGIGVFAEAWDDCVADDFINVSDRRMKQNIQSIEATLPRLMQLNPVTYEYIPAHNRDGRTRTGFIAQEVLEVFPNVVINEDVDVAEDGKTLIRTKSDYYSMNYIELIPITIKAIQEQQTKIEQLETEKADFQTKLDDLHTQNENMQKELDELKQLVQQLASAKPTSGAVQSSTATLSSAKLEQNQPNPFSEATTINYFVPENVKQAEIRISTIDGKLIKTVIVQNGQGQLTLDAYSLQQGSYTYTLFLDGKLQETKQMILTR